MPPQETPESTVSFAPTADVGVSPVPDTSKPAAKRLWWAVIGAGLLVAAGVGVYYATFSSDTHRAVQQFTNVYSLVPEKLSKSASIPITLPEGVDAATVREYVSFSPNVTGEWQVLEAAETDQLVFVPNKPLKTGVYYAVNVNAPTAQVSGDFFVDEDPQITAIFPASSTEAHEDSEITIVFNRPMVPLTTLDELDAKELPITITPATDGSFKWISTRSLQFVPATTLIPASQYRVSVGEGLYSIDGLQVAPAAHEFMTRPLRYESVSEGTHQYRAPIAITFNQPVDLAETSKEISVRTVGDNKPVVIEVEYGETSHYDRSARKWETLPDKSKLFIYQRRDVNGRARLWDFDTSYRVSIYGATALVGKVPLTESKISVVSVPTIIKEVTAQSEQSDAVRPGLFDPTGTLTVEFYDDIDLTRSEFFVKGMRSVAYAERCGTDEEGNAIRVTSGCEVEDDVRKIILTFDPDAFIKGESFTLTFTKMRTVDGLIINAKPIEVELTTYPAFKLLGTVPENGYYSADYDQLYLCTNVPLQDPGEAGLASYFETTGYRVFGRWSSSQYTKHLTSPKCTSRNAYQTRISLGLLPETVYDIKITPVGEFGQTVAGAINIKTRAADDVYTRFHNLQKQYNVTPSDRTKLTYAVENLEFVNMHICKLTPESFLQRTVQRAGEAEAPVSQGCSQVVQKRIELPVRYWVNNYFQVDIADYFPQDARGHYIISFGNPNYTTSSYNSSTRTRTKVQRYDRTYLSVTDLAVGSKEVEYGSDGWSTSENPQHDSVLDTTMRGSDNLYWVNEGKTLAPRASAKVTQYQTVGKDKTFTVAGGAFTDASGIARAPVQENLVGAVITSGTDSAVLSQWSDTLSSAGQARNASRTYVYTDRPIYRPGHQVHIKGIDRIGFDGEYEVTTGLEVPVKVYDSRRNEVFETTLIQSSYGTFATEFTLPIDAPLGTYQIEVFGQRSYFSVEEYVPAAFKLEATTKEAEYSNGDTFNLTAQAEYYFGAPVADGELEYSVTAQDYHFDRYTDEYFNFGRSWYYCYSCGYGDDFLFRGTVPIDDNGKADISRKIVFEDLFDADEPVKSKLLTIFLTAKDANGRSVSKQKTVIVHASDFYLGLKTDAYYTSLNTPITVRAKTVDQEGEPVSLGSIKRTLYKVEWETFKRQEVDGGFYYRSEKKRTEVESEQIRTDRQGDWKGEVVPPNEGQYEIELARTGKNGTQIVTTQSLYVHGQRSVRVPPNNNYELDIEVQSPEAEVGDTASILIKSPYETAKVLITAERGTVYDYWIADVTGGLYQHEFEIKPEYTPNVFVSALLLSGDPEVKHGRVRFEIDRDESKLEVAVTSNKTYYLPGEQVIMDVLTTDHTGRPVAAEVSLAVADLSVLALKGNPKKNPFTFFYDGFPLAVTTGSNIKNILHEIDIPLGTKGGGGGDPDDLAAKKRGVFKDTAFFEAFVETDATGKAQVSFTLPDNLTTWQIESVGVTKDTKLGTDYDEFTTKKDLMAVPLKPRFIVPGDTFSLGATVFNQSDKSARVQVEIESETLLFTGDTADTISVPAGDSRVMYFETIAPADYTGREHAFTFTAKSNNLVDSVDQVIAITPNTTYETTATANFTKDDRAVEYVLIPDAVVAEEGELTINANATLAVFTTDALEYMIKYPYGCSEQLASSLSTIGILKQALNLPNVEGDLESIEFRGETHDINQVIEEGLERIYQAQDSGGGFGYYSGRFHHLGLTMHILTALHELEKAGYPVRTDVVRRARTYVANEALSEYRSSSESSKDQIILAEYIWQATDGIGFVSTKDTKLTPLVRTLIADKKYLNEDISSLTLGYLAALTATGYSDTERDLVYQTLQNRIDIDGRGAYLSSVPSVNRGYYETPIKNTALLLEAFVAHDDEHVMTGNVLRWILSGRDNQGVWGSTHNTFSVVRAMVSYLEWQKESESSFTLEGMLDGKSLFNVTFAKETVFDTLTHVVPLQNLSKNTLLPLVFERTERASQESNLYYDIALRYFLPVAELPPRDEGITITRGLYALNDGAYANIVTAAAVGEVVKGHITLTIPETYNQVAVEDIIPAGFELVNFNLDTEDQSLLNETSGNRGSVGSSDGFLASVWNALGGQQKQNYVGGSYRSALQTLRPTHSEAHDDRTFLYFDQLQPGNYEYEYYLRALVPGEFQHLPARAEALYFPEIFGRTTGGIFTITEAE